MMKQKTTIKHYTLYQLTLVYHIIALLLIGTNFFIVHQLPYVLEHRPIGLAIDIVVLCTMLGLALYGLRRIKKGETSILETAERYQSLYDNHPDSIISFSLDGEVLSANHGLESLLGLGRENTTTSFIPMISPPDLLKALHHFQVASAGMPQNFEAAFIHQNGIPIPSNVTFVPTKVDGQVVGIYAILKDLTEVKEQKKVIDKLYKQNQLILNSVSEGIYGIDMSGRTIFWNQAAEAITGWKVDEMLGRQIHNLIRPEKADGTPFSREESPVLNTILNRDAPIMREDLFWRKDGTAFPVEFMSSPILEEKGHILGTVITFKDITELKKTQELLIKSDKLSAVGQLAAGVAHEIRNPLTALKGFLQLLKTNSTKEQYYIEIMQKELQRIEFIVNEFLFVSKPQATNFDTRTIDSIVISTIELLQPQAILENIQIEADIEPNLPPVSCDERQIKQVFINILKNALESMEEGGLMRIEAAADAAKKNITIRFIDQGCGIAPERLPKLGEPFYSTKEKGTGLGLMVCYRIIEAHGGMMEIQSKLEEGTTVEITLPSTQVKITEGVSVV
ncbi:PAS domain S-box protein [Paenibacillus sp. CGMCC 1.16610]|uniref:histidine kinase n=1 Tax=Paenibacillus anseongense TaxID=2682845 RepID=A0ABW9UNY9_9BACL|nr:MULTISPECIES: PAS domain S-box protein [Paenibacillus]MBA2943474.1 PAS domain S-box protein [Paenibacillus sp. CGMCC 1.16610]MVQ40453.1 PAS domain S-box protein [Paenibacillus anseongense]